MKVHYGVENLGIEKPFITIGSFDGVHRGHLHIIDALRRVASAQGAFSTVITFDPHPRCVLNPNEPPVQILSSMAEKIELLERAGVEHLIVLPFTKELAEMSYREFVEDFLIDKIGMVGLIVGYDHRFGKGREGDYSKLVELSNSLGFYLEQETPFSERDINISSTKIRNALVSGEVDLANNYLGYTYSCRGIVVEGFHVGRKIGFPTANIALDASNKMIPGNGVYAVRAYCDGREYCGMLDIGTRPTVHENGVRSIEANLFGLDGSIYGKELILYFVAKMRNEQRFNSCEELAAQLRRDKVNALSILGEY